MTRGDDRHTDGGPGARLRAAREAAGLGIEEVAERLHLLRYVVRALEHDEYERLRGDLFVRGYLRNYARLLGLDADEIVACWQRAHPETRCAPRVRVPASEAPRATAGAGRVGLVLLLLAASAFYLFHSRGPGAAGADRVDATVTVETAAGAQVVPLAAPEHLSQTDMP